MTDISERDQFASSPLAGLMPTRLRLQSEARDAAKPTPRETSRLAKGLFSTMPVLLVGSLAIATMNLTGAIDPVSTKRPHDAGSDTADLGTTIKDALAASTATVAAPPADTSSSTTDATPSGDLATASVPTSYTVRSGDTVSEIAGRYGLATASVLALNGLSWSSLIFPGQVLTLTQGAPTPPASSPTPSTGASTYTIVSGDTITKIANRFGVTISSLLQANGLALSSIIYAGRTLSIPGTAPASTPVTPPPVDTTPPATTPTTPVVTPPATASTTYTIVSGDTVTRIASRFGVTIQAILTANGLTASSIIYAGRTLIIPGVGTQPAQVGASITPLSPEMTTNALTIIAVGKQLGVPDYGIIIALAAAAQESGLRNLSSGDLDSVGLFQQRPSTGWGTPAQLENTSYASELFYGGPSNPNKGKTRGLLDIPGWQSMTLTQAAQAVQISAYPTAYAKWEASARAWYASLA